MYLLSYRHNNRPIYLFHFSCSLSSDLPVPVDDHYLLCHRSCSLSYSSLMVVVVESPPHLPIIWKNDAVFTGQNVVYGDL